MTRKRLLAAVLGPFIAFALPAQERLTVHVTAIELSVDVRDASGNVPPDLQPSDFVVLENGVERAVTAVEYPRRHHAGETPASADANVVVLVDHELSSIHALGDALRGLAAQAQLLTALGTVDLVITNPETRWLARGARDAETLAAAINAARKFPALDRLTAHRNDVLETMRLKARAGATLELTYGEARSAIRQEEALVENFHARVERILARTPRRPLNVLFLVSDGFDLDPMEFYSEFVTDPTDLAQLRAEGRRLGGKHDAFARSLAAAGWTVMPLAGGVVADFRQAASQSGRGKMDTRMSGTAVSMSAHRTGALLALAEATGGAFAGTPEQFAKLIASAGDRVRLTYQVPRAPDALPRRVEVRARRPGLTVRTSRWSSSSTPELTAAARTLEQLGGSAGGELPLAARLQLDERQRGRGTLEARLDLEPLAALRPQLTSTSLRVSIAVESSKEPARVVHQTVDGYDLSKLQRVLFTAPVELDANAARLSVLMEELTSGAWGGTTIELAPSSRERLFTSKGWDEDEQPDGIAWAGWDEGRARAQAEGKLLFVRVDQPAVCLGCTRVAGRAIYRHPAFRRHMAESFVPVRIDTRFAQSHGIEEISAVADPWGRVRFQWTTSNPVEHVTRLSLMKQFAPALLRAGAQLNEGESPEPHFTLGYVYAQTESALAPPHYKRARELALEKRNLALAERAEIHLALLDARGGGREKAKASLERIAAGAQNGENAAEALIVLGKLLEAAGDPKAALDAFSRAAARAPEASSLHTAALSLTGGGTRLLQPIQLVRPKGAVVAGRVQLQTLVRDARVDKVVFSVDGRQLEPDTSPPFSARLDLGDAVRAHTFHAQAFGRDGALIGEDTLRVNERHDHFAVRIASPRGGEASGTTRVELDISRPAGATIERVELYWNEEKRATLTAAPFAAELALPDEPGYVRAVATLADGTTAEDAVTLNVRGYAESIDVDMAELYARIVDGGGKPVTGLGASDFAVMDGTTPLEIVRAQYVGRPPLHLGVALDTSASMKEELLEMQAAAQEFLRNAFASEAKAFAIAFDDTPRLLHETTADLAALSARIELLRPAGTTTALYDALIFALLQFEGVPGKKALVVVSDGDDRSSRYSYGDVVGFARRAGVNVYAIVLESNPAVRHDIGRMAAQTGGKAFFIRNPRDMDAIYREIDERLGGQYLLEVRRGGEARALDVRVKKTGVDVR